MKTQIVVYPDKTMVEPCEQYYLAETYLDMESIHEKIQGKYHTLEYPFPTEEEYVEANKYITELSYRMIHSYGNKLNQCKNVNFSDRQWTLIMCNWLWPFLFVLYYKYCKLAPIKEQDVYLVGTDTFPEEKSAVDFTRSCVVSLWKNAYIWTYLAQAMGIECVIKNEIAEQKSMHIWRSRIIRAIKHPNEAIHWLKRRLSPSEKNTAKMEFENIDSVVETLLVETLLPEGMEQKLTLQSGGRVGYLQPKVILNMGREIVNKYDRNKEQRRLIFKDAFIPQTEFERIAHQAMIEFLPIAYVEAFDEMYTCALEITKNWNVQKFYSCYTSIELLDYCIALMLPHGIEINLLQHSATYGGCVFLAVIECVYADKFLTWGWEGLSYDWLHAKVLPVAIVRQPVPASLTNKEIKEKILYTAQISFLNDFGCGDTGNYFARVMQFFETLDESVRRQVYIRYDHNDDLNQELVRRCMKRFPEIHYEKRSEMSFTDSVLESKFLISEYYGSTHIEALCLGKPFVMFDALKLSVKSPYFVKHTQPLRDAGVYCEDGLQLAKVLNQKKGDIDWLCTDSIKAIYSEYLEAFTRMNQNVEKIWTDEILR